MHRYPAGTINTLLYLISNLKYKQALQVYIMKFSLIILFLFLVNPVMADDGVDITDPLQVSVLHHLQEKIDSISVAINGCMDTGEEHKSCMCKHKDLIIEFNTTAKKIFLNYPEFKYLDIVRYKSPDGLWISQSLEGIRRQASMEPCKS